MDYTLRYSAIDVQFPALWLISGIIIISLFGLWYSLKNDKIKTATYCKWGETKEHWTCLCSQKICENMGLISKKKKVK